MPMPRPTQRQPVITATEIGEFVYCAKAWQLKRDGAEADSPALAEGTAFHAKHGAGVAQAARLQHAARLLFALAVLTGLLLLWFVIGGTR